jgi:hypothetical protein
MNAQFLTPEAANCALSLALFRIFQVTGVNLTPPPEIGAMWQNDLMTRYPMVPNPYLVANACAELRNIPANWAYMAPVEREAWQNMWAVSLPHDLALLEPLSAGARELRVALQARAAQQHAAASAPPNTEAGAYAKLGQWHTNATTLNSFWRSFYGPR